jgi:uncharacterized membrane protein AbrB (regulator of aidB expression)
MILLQAALAFGYLLFYVGLPIFLLIGTPITVGIFMKLLWRLLGKTDYIKTKAPS